RLTGYSRALKDARIRVNPDLVYEGEFSIQSGYDMAQAALRVEPPPTAMVGGNNFITLGALRGIRDVGLHVPEDIALVGFDGIPDHLMVDPFFTSSIQPAYEMGRRAMQLLIARLEGHAPAEFQEIVLPTRLVISKSSGQRINSRPDGHHSSDGSG
ncbi:MAG TPA: substrate-binding domain-containing protein, partial [Aggregatilineales bacterium]|nr:substrate-binding domain-containing protein [Aggregatilineales bacterium]